jgi:hypothetical protein
LVVQCSEEFLGDGFELPVSGKRHVKVKVLLGLL